MIYAVLQRKSPIPHVFELNLSETSVLRKTLRLLRTDFEVTTSSRLPYTTPQEHNFVEAVLGCSQTPTRADSHRVPTRFSLASSNFRNVILREAIETVCWDWP